MAMTLKEREKLFLQMVSQGHTYKDAYITILKKAGKSVNVKSAEVGGARMAKRLYKEVEDSKIIKEIKAKKEEVEQRLDYVNKLETVERKERVIALRRKRVRTVKEQAEIMELLKYDVSTPENIVKIRGILLEKGMEEFEIASAIENPAYKATIFKACVDLAKMGAPEKTPTDINLNKPPKEILQGIINKKGLDKETVKLLGQYIASVNNEKELQEAREVLKELQEGTENN